MRNSNRKTIKKGLQTNFQQTNYKKDKSLMMKIQSVSFY